MLHLRLRKSICRPERHLLLLLKVSLRLTGLLLHCHHHLLLWSVLLLIMTILYRTRHSCLHCARCHDLLLLLLLLYWCII